MSEEQFLYSTNILVTLVIPIILVIWLVIGKSGLTYEKEEHLEDCEHFEGSEHLHYLNNFHLFEVLQATNL